MLLSFIIVTLKISVLSALIYIGSYFALKRSDMKIGLYLSLASFIQFALTFGWVYLSMPMLNTSFNYIYGNLMASVIAGIVVYFVSLAAPMQRPHTHRERTFWFIPAALLTSVAILLITMKVAAIGAIDDEFASIDVEEVKESEELKSTEETKVALSAITAKSKMSKMMSVVPNSNAYDLGTITAQTINGEYVYVASLEFDSFWK